MKKSILALVAVLLVGTTALFAQSGSTENGDAILGKWVNAKQDAKFEIYKKDNQYFGKIIWGTGGDDNDTKNPDPALRSRELVGLTILNDFVFEGKNTWTDGTIYDPKDGKTYSCKLTLTAGGKLEVRGFVGISLFGRTETWSRIN